MEKRDDLSHFTRLSDLIDAAVDDLIACTNEGMGVDMNRWYVESSSKKYCSVCFAGAVMAQRLNLPEHGEADLIHNFGGFYCVEKSPYSLQGLGLINKLEALNSIRRGNILSGFRQFYRGYFDSDGRPTDYAKILYSADQAVELLEKSFGKLEDFSVTQYETDPTAFIGDMRNVARLLRFINH